GLCVAAARGHVAAAQVLAVVDGAGPRPRAVTSSPYRGLAAFGEQDAGWFFGREAAIIQVLERMSRLLAGGGLLGGCGAAGGGESAVPRGGGGARGRGGGAGGAGRGVLAAGGVHPDPGAAGRAGVAGGAAGGRGRGGGAAGGGGRSGRVRAHRPPGCLGAVTGIGRRSQRPRGRA